MDRRSPADPGRARHASLRALAANAPGFSAAIDSAGLHLGNGGRSIEDVTPFAMLGMDEQGYGFFPIMLTAKRA